jgi:hypothetical protein
LSCGQLYPGGDGGKRRNSGGHKSILSEERAPFWLI